MDVKRIRDILKLTVSILFFWVYIPHILVYVFASRQTKDNINGDLNRLKGQ